MLIIINYNLVMGNLFAKKNKLNEYAVNFVDYQQYTDLDDIDGLKHSIYDLRNEMNTIVEDLQKKLQNLKIEINDINNSIIKNNQNINNYSKLVESSDIQLESMQELIANKFKLYNKDLEALLNNDKLLLRKMELLNPDIKNENTEEITDLIKSSYMESNVEYCSFINQ